MSKGKPPAYQHYAADFLTGTAEMSCAEVGAYIRLLDHAWDSTPIATLPDDSEKLRRMAGAERDEWKTIEPVVRAKFRNATVEGKKRLINDRMAAQFKELAEHKEKMSERGKAGADARWNKDEE